MSAGVQPAPLAGSRRGRLDASASNGDCGGKARPGGSSSGVSAP